MAFTFGQPANVCVVQECASVVCRQVIAKH